MDHRLHAPLAAGPAAALRPGGPAASRRWYLPLATGAGASVLLLGIYFGALALVSGWEFTRDEFARWWPFIVALALGFGVQVALFTRLRRLAAAHGAGKVVAASGTTSTAAMVSCCAHYLASAAPVLGATGLVAFAAQFQVELFWAGLLFSAAGIAFVGSRLRRAEREHAACEH